MKYPFRYLFALVAIVAMLLQGGRALREYRQVKWLEVHLLQQRTKLHRINDSWRVMEVHSKLCRQVNDSYQYPGDLAVAERRYQQLGERKERQ
jgi:hypothetical protein